MNAMTNTLTLELELADDLTQIDLLNPQKSGLQHAIAVLTPISKISFNYLYSHVVRHPLVAKIVDAYNGCYQSKITIDKKRVTQHHHLTSSAN